MDGWGITNTESEKEKIKAVFIYYLKGLNSRNAISWNDYSEAFDISMELFDKMYELGQQEACMREQQEIVHCKDCKNFSGVDDDDETATAIGCCRHPNHEFYPCRFDFFCADKERK